MWTSLPLNDQGKGVAKKKSKKVAPVRTKCPTSCCLTLSQEDYGPWGSVDFFHKCPQFLFFFSFPTNVFKTKGEKSHSLNFQQDEGLLMKFAVFVCAIVGLVAVISAARHQQLPRRTPSLLNASLVDVMLDAPPRYMWGWGGSTSGYCGSTSFQTNGIFWGNWVSSEMVRAADGGSELLIGVNDNTAAKNLKFKYEQWNFNKQKTPQGSSFVAWLRSHIDQGHISAVGFYESQPSGDEDYDHIVPVIGYQYDSNTDATTGIYYNDLWSPETRMIAVPSGITSRNGCQQDDEPDQPFEYCIPKTYCYGIAFLGDQDTNSETYRMMLQMPNWTEPDYGKEDKVNAKPVMFTVSASFMDLSPGASYTVYRFDSYSTLPTSSFAKGPFTKSFQFTASAAFYQWNNFDSFMSNSTIFYRTVLTP